MKAGKFHSRGQTSLVLKSERDHLVPDQTLLSLRLKGFYRVGRGNSGYLELGCTVTFDHWPVHVYR